MDVKELADEKKLLSSTLRKSIREFEQKTGLLVVGIKIIHDGPDALTHTVEIKAELP